MVDVHVLASGSDGNCTIIESGDEAIMIDAGISYRRFKEQTDLLGVDPSKVKAVMLTHEHNDHIGGLGPICRKLKIPLRANEATFCASENKIGSVELWAFRSNEEFDVGGFHLVPLPTFHDAVEPTGFYITVNGKRILYVTDTGHFSFQIEHALSQADLAMVETNYDNRMLMDGPYPYDLKMRIRGDHGHMCNDDTAKAISERMRPETQLFLMHLSKINNTPDTARGAVEDAVGIRKLNMDCLELPNIPNDCRTLRV